MKYDDEIKKALNLRAENVSVDGNMLYSIKRKIKNQRRIGMNKFKKAVIVCCTVLVIGVTGVYGGGKIISYTSSRHLSASSKKKSDVIHTRISSPLCTL